MHTDLLHQPITGTTAVAGQTARSNWRDILFFVCIALSLTPLISFVYLPLSDGPSHIYNAHLMRDILRGEGGYTAWLIDFNPTVVPNWLSHVLLAGALTVFDGTTAERLLIALYVLLLAFAFRYALRGIDRDTKGCEFLIFPILFNSHVHWGFYNFCLSLAMYLLVTGFWLHHRTRMTVPRTIALSGLVIILFFCHPVSLVESIMAIGVLGVWHWICTRRMEILRNLAWTAAAFLPSVALLLWFVSHRVYAGPTAAHWVRSQWGTPVYAGSNLLKLTPLKSFFASEMALTISLGLFVAAASAAMIFYSFRRRYSLITAGFGLLVFLQAAFIFIAPSNSGGGGMITPRLIYYPLFSVGLWLVAGTWNRFWRTAFAAVPLLLALGFHTLHWPAYRAYDARMQSIVQAIPKIPAHSTIVFLTTGPVVTLNTTGAMPAMSPNMVSYIATRDNLIHLNNFAPATDHYPFIYRTAAYPEDTLFRADGTLDPDAYFQKTGKHTEYILLWGWGAAVDRKTLDEAAGIARSKFHYREMPLPVQDLPLRLLRLVPGN